MNLGPFGKWLCARCRGEFKTITYFPVIGQALCEACAKQYTGTEPNE